jgi:hypothetical protein
MVLQYRVGWSGATVTGPGVTVFHSRPQGGATGSVAGAAEAARVRNAFVAVQAQVPAGVTWDFPGEVTELDTATGTLIAVHTFTKPADLTSTGSATSWARPAGGRVDWFTDGIVAGRRLRGRSFLVPLTGASYDGTGTLVTGAITALSAFAAARLATSASVAAAIWSRTHGVSFDVTSFDVPDEVAILRSRRD